MLEPIHTTGLVSLVGIDDQVDQNDYSASAQLDLAAAAGLPAGAPVSGEILHLLLSTAEADAGETGAVQKPAGTLILFAADPGVDAGDTALSAAARAAIVAQVTLAATDWKGDATGAAAVVLAKPIAFHAVPALWAAWLHEDTTGLNSEAGDDETLHVAAWFRRER